MDSLSVGTVLTEMHGDNDMPKLIENNEFFDLSEIYQEVDLKFAPLIRKGSNYEMLHIYVQCRDYFTDLVDAMHMGEDYEEVYGIAALGETEPWANDLTYIALAGTTSYITKYLPLLQAFEKECGLTPTTMEMFENSADVLVTGSVEWSSAGPYISLYTHLLRCMYSAAESEECDEFDTMDELLSFIAGASRGNDSDYQSTISKFLDIKMFIKNVKKFASVCLGHPMDGSGEDGVTIIHNYGGIVSLAKVIGDDFDDCRWKDDDGIEHTDEEYDGPMTMHEDTLKLYMELS